MPNQDAPKGLKHRLSRLKATFLRDNVLVNLVQECLIELRRQSVREKALVQAHLRRLADPAGFSIDQVQIGYALERMARVTTPTFLLAGEIKKPVLCMICIGTEFSKAVALGTQSKLDYCRRHGYGLAVLEAVPRNFDRPLSWLRIPLILRLLKMGYQSVFYLDADSLISNPDVCLETFFERLEKAGRHLLIADDPSGLNTGSVFYRRTWQSLLLLDLIYETDSHVENSFWEQTALIELVREYPQVLSLLLIESDLRQFNSMPFDSYNIPLTDAEREIYAWHPNDFICHFAGVRSGPELEALMRKIQREQDGSGPGS